MQTLRRIQADRWSKHGWLKLAALGLLAASLDSSGVPGPERPVSAQASAVARQPSAPPVAARAPKSAQSNPRAAAAAGQAVLWQEPRDLEQRDLFYGSGGRAGAPDPADQFTFLADKGSPADSNPKINVRDTQGRLWTVKFGPEVKAETAATRLVWAVGYHVDQDYFVPRATIQGFTRLPAETMRFERQDDGTEKVGRWKWEDNPFNGTRELNGLKTLMALLNNVDLTERNNRIIRWQAPHGPGAPLIYYVNDLGSSLGSTGSWFTSLPWLDKLATEIKGDPHEFAKNGFIEGVERGTVNFHITRRQAKQAVSGVPVEHARWLGNLLARLSEKQLHAAFRAGGFAPDEISLYVREIRARVAQLQMLNQEVASPGGSGGSEGGR